MSPLGKLGSWSYRHRRLVAAAWLVVLILVSAGGRMAGSAFRDDLNGGTGTPSQQAASFLHRHSPARPVTSPRWSSRPARQSPRRVMKARSPHCSRGSPGCRS